MLVLSGDGPDCLAPIESSQLPAHKPALQDAQSGLL
jgi:hypothetical protein